MIKVIDTWVDLAKAGFLGIAAGKPEHFEAIGRFALAVSNEIDGRLNACLQVQIASGEEAVTRIVVGEMRIGDIMHSLTRIANSRTLDSRVLKSMSDLFFEISILRHVRDVVLHRAFLVNGDKLAFHNAFLAKTDSAIEVDIYTLAELNEFTGYAKRLGYRVMRLGEVLHPIPQSPLTHAFLVSEMHRILLTLVLELVKSGTVSKEKLIRFRELESTLSNDIKAYVEAAGRAGENFAKLQLAVTVASAKAISAIGTIDAPDDLALHEIPARLQKKERTHRKDISRSRERQPRPSRE